MAVAKAQHAIAELTIKLRARGVNVRFAIHPVAGRLPGTLMVHCGSLLDSVHILSSVLCTLPDVIGFSILTL